MVAQAPRGQGCLAGPHTDVSAASAALRGHWGPKPARRVELADADGGVYLYARTWEVEDT